MDFIFMLKSLLGWYCISMAIVEVLKDGQNTLLTFSDITMMLFWWIIVVLEKVQASAVKKIC